MDNPPPLLYHRETFNLARQVPTLQEVSDLFEKIENAYHLQLPPAVKEWYSLVEATGILAHYSNADRPLSLQEILDQASEWHQQKWDGMGERTPTDAPTLPFLWENQGVFVACLLIDGSEDSPVIAWDDDLEWKPWNDHFSDFLLEWIWGYLDYGKLPDMLTGPNLRAERVPLTPVDFDFLKNHFVAEAPIYPPSTLDTWVRGDQLIRIWNRGDTTHWWLFADSKASLAELVRLLHPLGTLTEALSANRYSIGAEVLQELRPDSPRYWEDQRAQTRGT